MYDANMCECVCVCVAISVLIDTLDQCVATVIFTGNVSLAVRQCILFNFDTIYRQHKGVALACDVIWWLRRCIFYVKLLCYKKKLCGRPPQYATAPCKLTFDLLTMKVVSESRVTWPTSVPILVFLGLSVLDLGPMYATVRRQTSDRRQTRIIA